jgi:hypothetical protein
VQAPSLALMLDRARPGAAAQGASPRDTSSQRPRSESGRVIDRAKQVYSVRIGTRNGYNLAVAEARSQDSRMICLIMPNVPDLSTTDCIPDGSQDWIDAHLTG